MITEKIDQDLKRAMLAGDKLTVATLRGLKSALQYSQVGKQGEIKDDQAISVLQKEAKKRHEAADLYEKGGNSELKDKELAEKKIIENYLPAQLSEEQISKIIDEAISELGVPTNQNMGQIIGKTKAKTAGAADGGVIAKLVKGRIK